MKRGIVATVGSGAMLAAVYFIVALSLGVAPSGPDAPTTPEATAPSGIASSAAPRTAPPLSVSKSRVETRTFESAALRRRMPYTLWLPPGYDSRPTQRYPTLYLLHGGSGTSSEWADYGILDAADRLVASGAIPPLVIVLPQGDQEYWVDHVIDRATGANGERWGTYTARDVVPEIDRRYRTIAAPQGRAIGGLSMGGHGALQLPLSFPGIWSVVGAHSPSLRPVGDAPTYLGTGAEFAARDPLALIRARPELARTLSYWIDQGDADPWRSELEAIHAALDSLGIAHAWNVYPGDHSLEYWSAHVEDYLRFYAGALCGGAAGRCPATLGR